MDSPNLQFVREVWRTLDEEGVASGLEVLFRQAHPDIVLKPYYGEGSVLRGVEAIRANFDEAFAAGTTISLRAYHFSEEGDTVEVSGAIRVVEPGGALAETQVRWLYHFRDGLVDEVAWSPRSMG